MSKKKTDAEIKQKIEADMERDIAVKIKREKGELTINDCATLKKMVEYLIERYNQCESKLKEKQRRKNARSPCEETVKEKKQKIPKSVTYV